MEIEKRLDDMQNMLVKLAESVEKLTEIQVRQEEHSDALKRSFKSHEECQKRLWDIEQKIPVFEIVKNIVFYGTGFALTAVLTAVIGVVII